MESNEGQALMMMNSPRHRRFQWYFGFLVTFTCSLWFLLATHGARHHAYAQVTPSPITSSGLNTQVSGPINLPAGKVQYDITGGTRPNNGLNLFHSFGELGVPTNNIANFFNDSGLQTSNILSRVTGGNPSNIFGTLQTTGFGSANLFLMNPAGIVFGPNATLNVGGSVNFTTADYLRLTDGARFHAVPNSQDTLLSAAPVAAFGFLGTNPAAIVVEGSILSVPPGESISFIGGNISISAGAPENNGPQAARLSAPGGQIRLASVASQGEVLNPTLDSAANINNQTFSSMGAITVSGNATIDVSGDTGGSVKIRSGQLVIEDAIISADTVNAGASVAIDIQVQGDVSIADTRGASAITARTTGAGDAGEVRISSTNFQATSTSEEIFSLLDTHTSGTGRGGNVSITADNVIVAGLAGTNAFFFIDSGTGGSGRGGDVTITAASIDLDHTTISTGDFLAINTLEDPSTVSGSAGNIQITGNSLQVKDAILNTGAFASSSGTQKAGDITINGHDVNMHNVDIGLFGPAQGGTVRINADRFITDFTSIETDTTSGPGGGIVLTAPIVELTNGSSLISNTFGDGPAGDIVVTANDHVSLFGITGENPLAIFRPTGLFSNAFGTLGNAGNIIVNTPRLEMVQGRINTSTASSGHGGNVIINADNISISGEFPNLDFEPEPVFKITDIHPSGVFTKTVGTEFCSGPCGNAGDISISARSLAMGNGSQIDSGTSNTGHGGNIAIRATDTISIAGILTNGTPVGIFSRTIGAEPGSGNGGAITLQAQNVSISNGAAISAESAGAGASGSVTIEGVSSPANAIAIQGPGSGIFTSAAGEGAGGNISLDANTVQLSSGTISAATSKTDGNARGGNVHIVAGNLVQLQNGSTISSSSAGHGNAGDIIIEAGQAFQMQNSSVTTEAAQASGGNITINAVNALQLSNSLINTSVFGPAGTVGGDITIDPNFVTLQNSQIRANANAGQGGNILITAGLFLTDATSVIDASAQSGINGTVTIQSPVSNLSANWARLQQSYLEAAALLRQRCAAKMSTGSSSLVMAGRDRIPLEPGTWLSSPVGVSTSHAGTSVALSTDHTRLHLSKSSFHNRDGEFSIRRYGISPVFHSIMDAGCAP